jgi:nucleotide-binding universal stress UspA family protein
MTPACRFFNVAMWAAEQSRAAMLVVVSPGEYMLKNMVVSLPMEPSDDAFTECSISLAREFDAHLAAVAFAYEDIPESATTAKAKVAKFEETTRGSAISTEARWMTASFTGMAELFGRIARRFDLSVVRQAEADKPTPDRLIIEAALFDSGRPVLVVPYRLRGGIKFDRVLVCWDGSRSAARAVGDAVPFLKRAKVVEVVIVGDEVKSTEIPGADIAPSLARHGIRIRVDVKRIAAPSVFPESVILPHAADSSADIMVMGGYGHSKWREFVLGGVTRNVLSRMTIPTLMSH